MIHPKDIVVFILSCLALSTYSLLEAAEDPYKKGEEIVRKWDHCKYGFKDFGAPTYKLIMTNSQGEEAVREMRLRVLEVPIYDKNGDKIEGDKSLMEFLYPPDVKGTALLIYAHVEKSDDTWLYLPALKRVKRISSDNKSGSFAGTEFSYEDTSSQELKKFTYKWLRDEPCGDRNELQCSVIEQIPTYEHSGYSKQISWYDKSECRQFKIDYYDHKNVLVKTQTFRDYRQYLNKYWRGHNNLMVNHITGAKTHLLIDKFEYQKGLKPGEFNPERLKSQD